MYNLNETFTEVSPLAYFFGHHHYPIHTFHRGTNYVNCSVLDNDHNRWRAGNYWVLNFDGERLKATPKPLQRPSRSGYLSGGLSKRRQQAKLFNQLYPDLAIPDLTDANCSTPVDKDTFAKLISK